jgi:hypothetical protein
MVISMPREIASKSTEERVVTMKQFVDDTRGVFQRAEREGPIVVIDDDGRPRMSLHCPSDSLPVGD